MQIWTNHHTNALEYIWSINLIFSLVWYACQSADFHVKAVWLTYSDAIFGEVCMLIRIFGYSFLQHYSLINILWLGVDPEGNIKDCSCEYETVLSFFSPLLSNLTAKSFFRYIDWPYMSYLGYHLSGMELVDIFVSIWIQLVHSGMKMDNVCWKAVAFVHVRQMKFLK